MWNTLVPQFKAKPKKTQTKTRQNSDDPQISRPDLRFASRKHSKTTQKGPGHNQNTHARNTGWLGPRVIEKCTTKQISRSMAINKGREAVQLWTSATNLRSAVYYGNLRVLSDVLFLPEGWSTSGVLAVAKRAWAYIRKGYRDARTSRSCVVRPTRFSGLLQQCRPSRGQHCGPRQILQQGQAAGKPESLMDDPSQQKASSNSGGWGVEKRK